MATRPILDSLGWFLVGAGFGVGSVFLFMGMGWRLSILLACWLVAVVGWATGRLTRTGLDEPPDTWQGNSPP